ncbi:hypothetical protein pb186bvf_017739 [Paramecium bursaria]
MQQKNHIVSLQHVNRKGYLKGTISALQRTTYLGFIPLKYYSDNNRFYVVLDQESDQWILKTKYDFSNKIRYGDEFTLQNKTYGLFLNSFPDELSETTSQGLMCLSTKPQWFFIQPTSLQLLSIEIDGTSIVRILNSQNKQALHSHQEKYFQSQVNQYKEVTSYSNRDDNDFWYIQQIQPPNEIVEAPVQQGDIVIIRNVYDIQYLSFTNDSVICKSPPQDENTPIFIDIIFDNDQYIDELTKVYLQQVGTNFCLDFNQTGDIVLNPYQQEPLRIIPLTREILMVGQPFYIQRNFKYLTRTDNEQLSLIEFPNIMSIWVIEQHIPK